MASKIVVSNQDRYDEYVVLIDGTEKAGVFPLTLVTVEVPPGSYVLSFRSKAEAELPVTCKSIRVTLKDISTLSLYVKRRNLSIGIYDEQQCQLNARYGFLCGWVADGVHIENPIE
jgi:hypothetical protein